MKDDILKSDFLKKDSLRPEDFFFGEAGVPALGLIIFIYTLFRV